jgi:hypothetical protein
MAANTQQGTYLATALTGFTAYVAGRVVQGGIGLVVALAGLALVIVSVAGFRKIRDLG